MSYRTLREVMEDSDQPEFDPNVPNKELLKFESKDEPGEILLGDEDIRDLDANGVFEFDDILLGDDDE